MSIECMKFISVNKGNLVGYADFYVPKMGLEIFGCSMHLKDSRRWINLPTREYVDDQGQKKYSPVIRFRDKAHNEKFIRLALDAIEKKCAQKPIEIVDEEEVPF